jgi:phosphoserine phosphatase RsbU/P
MTFSKRHWSNQRECLSQIRIFAVIDTDGVSETGNSEHEEFGMERLMDVVAKRRPASASTFTPQSAQPLAQFVGDEPTYDDSTLVVLKFS